MSDVEARVVDTLSPPAAGRLRFHGATSGGMPTAEWITRRRLFAALLILGDIICGGTAVFVVAVIADVAGFAGQIDLADRLRIHMPMTLLLLVGICCILGLYRLTTKSLIERFRLRVMAMLLFVFVEILMWARDGLS